MLNIRRGWLVPVTMLNIGYRRRREQPKDTSEGVTWPSVTTDVAQLPVAYTQGNTERGSSDLRSHPVLLLRKRRGKKPGMRRTYFRSGPLPVTWLCHFRSKGPTRADMAQLPVADAQNILPYTVISGHVTDVTSGHITSGSTPSQHLLKCDFVRPHILLMALNTTKTDRHKLYHFGRFFLS